ncbi:MAG: T9SS type A sorting domain-containing protein, partial [Flavobacteriales bacterium]|nr:T9SS type A sorting domain-containing protein [Flavobacteriales bacterium]
VQVYLHDLIGKELAFEQVVPSGNQVYETLDLPTDLASGTYIVTIIAGNQRMTEKLVITK